MDSIQMEPIGKFKTDRNGSAKAMTIHFHMSYVERGAWRVVAEQDVDDVAFLTDQQDKSSSVAPPGGAPIAVCSQRKALWLAAFVFSAIFGSALVLAYAGPASNCPCPNSVLSDLNWAIGQTSSSEGSQSGSSAVRLSTSGAVFPWKGNRLPMTVVPLNYRLWLHPNLTTGDLRGEVSIDMRVERETTYIVLNCRHLILTEKAISSATKTLSIAKVLYYPQADQVYIEVKDKFKRRNNYTLSLRYTGRLNTQEQRGLYIVNNDDSALAASRFWLRGARSAFPCFDEPSMRATFTMTIVRDRFHVSLTNTPVVATEEAGFYLGHRLLQDEFAKTPPVSSYMLSIIVCSLSRISTKYTSRTPNTLDLILQAQNNQTGEIRNYAPVNMTTFNVTLKSTYISLYGEQKLLDNVSRTLDWISQTLQSFEQRLNFTYPLQKLDIVCSEGINSGSGEGGWGLIVVSPHSLTNTRVMARMIAHQWFGGLVSPRWWNSLWLMEAMVNVLVEKAPSYNDVVKGYMESITSESADVGSEHKLILEHILPALRLDASDAPITGGQIPNYSNSKSANQARLDRPDLDLVSDDLAVHKGAAVVGMALWAGGAIRANTVAQYNHTGDHSTNGNSIQNGFTKFLRYIPNFSGGSSGTILALARFLKRRALSTAEPKDLWAAAAPRTLPSDCWDSWSEQSGYPLVTISRRGKDLVITQERFLLTADPPDWLSGNSEKMVTSQLITDAMLEGSLHGGYGDDDANSTISLLDDGNLTMTVHTTTPPPPRPRRKGPQSIWTVPLALKLGPLEDTNATVNPLYYDVGERKESDLFVWMNETEVVLEGLGSVAYVKCNIGGRALYRCFVSEDLDHEKSELDRKMSLNSAESALRLDDFFILALNGKISPMKALKLAAKTLTTDDEVPASVKAVAIQRLHSLRSILCKSIASTAFDTFLSKIATAVVKNNKLSLRNSAVASPIDSILMLAAVKWGDPKLTDEASAIFRSYAERNVSIPDNVYEAVITGAIRTDSSHFVWDRVWSSFLLPLIVDKRENGVDSKAAIVSIDPLSVENDAFGVKCLYGQCSDDRLTPTLRALASTQDDWLLDRFIHTGARLGSSVVVQERENRTNFYHNINILTRDVVCYGHSSFAFTRAALTETTALTLHAVNVTRSALRTSDDRSLLLKETLKLRKRLEGLRRAVIELCECAKTEYEYYEASQLLSLVGDQGGRGASALRRSAANVRFVAEQAEELIRNLPTVL